MRARREDESDGGEIEVERVRKSSNVTLYCIVMQMAGVIGGME